MEHLAEQAAHRIARLRRERPLIHCITNPVTVNFVANGLLALGASPVMASAVEEVGEMVAHAAGLMLNIGTPCPAGVAAMVRAAERAAQRGIPVVFDPVGVGSTGFRTASARSIMETGGVTAVRGNASEIRVLEGASGWVRGVDASHSVTDVEGGLDEAARRLGAVLCVTGPEDLVSDGRRRFRVGNGDPLMARVTGMGCAATAVMAAFLAVDDDPAAAAAGALAIFGLAGEMAALTASGPGGFAVGFLDALHGMAPADVAARCRIREEKEERTWH
jgi:hydroxyethylthiazole kinase